VTWPRFFTRALRAGTTRAGVTTDRAPAYPRVLDELIRSALHTVERYTNNLGRSRSSPSPRPILRTDRLMQHCLSADVTIDALLRGGQQALDLQVPTGSKRQAGPIIRYAPAGGPG
jgi:hypothetical protein